MNSVIENFFRERCDYSEYGGRIRVLNKSISSREYDKGYHDGYDSALNNKSKGLSMGGTKSKEYEEGFIEGWSKFYNDCA